MSQNNQERRRKLIEIFHEGKEFYQIKDLQRLAKEKGMVQKYVKETLQSLVDDGIVKSDKIGSNLFYWSFPAKKIEEKKTVHELKVKNKELNEKIENLNRALSTKRVEQKKSDDENMKRNELKIEIDALKAKEKELMEFLNGNQIIADKADFAKIKAQTNELCFAANRWTDNVYNARNWIIKRFSQEESALNKEFNIPENFEYISLN